MAKTIVQCRVDCAFCALSIMPYPIDRKYYILKNFASRVKIYPNFLFILIALSIGVAITEIGIFQTICRPGILGFRQVAKQFVPFSIHLNAVNRNVRLKLKGTQCLFQQYCHIYIYSFYICPSVVMLRRVLYFGAIASIQAI